MNSITRMLVLACVAAAIGGCQSVYYKTMEKVGIEKRDLLVKRVADARDAQQEGKEQFSDALAQLSALANFDGGDLEKIYDKLNSKLVSSEAAAADVKDRIGRVETVARDLFREWDAEIEQYTSADLRAKSRQARLQTEASYVTLVRKMRAAEARMYPVLDLFRDQVLFLKHNLNARAIASLETETGVIEAQVRRLVAEMEASIAEADAFIASMQ